MSHLFRSSLLSIDRLHFIVDFILNFEIKKRLGHQFKGVQEVVVVRCKVVGGLLHAGSCVPLHYLVHVFVSPALEDRVFKQMSCSLSVLPHSWPWFVCWAGVHGKRSSRYAWFGVFYVYPLQTWRKDVLIYLSKWAFKFERQFLWLENNCFCMTFVKKSLNSCLLWPVLVTSYWEI